MHNGACLYLYSPIKYPSSSAQIFLRIYNLGMKLRKVVQERSDKVKKQYGNDIMASILKRNIFLKTCDSSGGESDSDSSDSKWND